MQLAGVFLPEPTLRDLVPREGIPLTGKKIVAIRKRYGLTRKEFARLLGMNSHELKAYEKGRKPVPAEDRRRLRQLADPRQMLQILLLRGDRLFLAEHQRLVQELIGELPALPAPPSPPALPPHQPPTVALPSAQAGEEVAVTVDPPSPPPVPASPSAPWEPLLRDVRRSLLLVVFLMVLILIGVLALLLLVAFPTLR